MKVFKCLPCSILYQMMFIVMLAVLFSFTFVINWLWMAVVSYSRSCYVISLTWHDYFGSAQWRIPFVAAISHGQQQKWLRPKAVIVADNVLKPGAPLYLWFITRRGPCSPYLSWLFLIAVNFRGCLGLGLNISHNCFSSKSSVWTAIRDS